MYASIIEKLHEVIITIPHVRINKKNCQKLSIKLHALLDAIKSLSHSKTFISERASCQLESLIDDILKFVEKSSSKSLFNGLYKSKLLGEYIALDHSLTELLLEEPKLLTESSRDVSKTEVSAPVTVRQNSGSGAGDPEVIMRWIRENTTISRNKAQLYATKLVQYGVSTVSSLILALQQQPDALAHCNVDTADQVLLIAALRHYQGTPQVSPRYETAPTSPDLAHVVDQLMFEFKLAVRENNVTSAGSVLRAISQACQGNAAMQTKFGQSGICVVLCNFLFTSLTSSSACEAVLQCICHLSRHGTTRDSSHEANIIAFGQAGACDAIIAAMNNHSTIYNVLYWGAHAILNLSVNPTNSGLFGKAGACATIAQQLQQQKHTTQTEDSVSHYIWGALINLALNVENNVLLSQAGACRAVVDVWKNHRQNQCVALWGCMAVQNLSLNSQNSADLGDLGVCRLITYSIKHFPDENMLTQAILAVQNLVGHPKNNAELGKLGMCEYIVRTFDIVDSSKCERYCIAMMNLSFKNTENKLRFGRSACSLLLQVLLSYADDPAMVEKALGAVANLVDDSCIDNIIHCGDIGMCEVLLSTMKLHIEDEIICELSCWVAKSLSQYLPNAIVLGSGGIAELISRILRTFLGVESVVDMACFALEILTYNKDVCCRLIRANAHEMIIKTLQMHKQNERIVLHCCNSICVMCNSELCARSFQALSAYGVVSSAIKCHFANEAIQKVGFSVLHVFSSEPSSTGDIRPLSPDDVIALSTASDAIVALNALRLAVYYQNEQYTFAALKCTHRLASSNPSAHKIFVSQGVCEYISYLFYPALSSAEGCETLMDVIAVMARPRSTKESSSIEAITQLGERGMCRGCTLALKKYVADTDIVVAALRAITYLCCDKNVIRFGGAGCCEAVIESISMYKADRNVALQAWNALINISLEEVNCKRCESACEQLIDAFQSWHDYSGAMECLILAAYNLSSVECNRDKLTGSGIATLLCTAMKYYSDVEYIAKYGCMTAQRLAQNPTGVSLLGKSGICEVLVMLLRMHAGKESIVEEVLSALVSLSSSEHCESFVKSGLCEALPKVMKEYALVNEAIAEYSAALVYYACLHTSAAALFDYSVFDIITKILTTHCTYEIVDNCCSAILYLCINNEENFVAMKNLNAYSAMMAGVDGIATEHYISETCRRALILFEPSVESFASASATVSAASSANSSPKAKKMSPVHKRESGESVKDVAEVESAQQWQYFCDAMIARDNAEMLGRLIQIRKLANADRQLVLMRTSSTMQIIFSALSSDMFTVETYSSLLEILALLLKDVTLAQYQAMVGKLELLPVILRILRIHYEMKSVTTFSCDCVMQLLRLNAKIVFDTLLLCDIAMHFMDEDDTLRVVLSLLQMLVSKYPSTVCDGNMLVCLLRRSELSVDILLQLLNVIRTVAHNAPLFSSVDIISAVIASLQIHAADARACEAILSTLSFGLSQCVSTEVPRIVVDDFDTLMCVIREHDGNHSISALGWGSISVLLQHKTDNCDQYIAAHGGVLLKLAFDNWQANETVLRHLLQICSCLNRRSDVELPITDTLAHILKYYTSDVAIAKASQGQSNSNDILALVLQCIVAMCDKRDENRTIFGDMYCCENTIAAMTLILKSEAVVIGACNAIRALAMHTSNLKKFTTIGAFAVVLRILQKNYSSYDIALHGLLALAAVPDFDQMSVVYDVIQKVMSIHIQTDVTEVCLSLMSQFSVRLMSQLQHASAQNGKSHALPLFAIEVAAHSLSVTDHPMIVQYALVVLLHAVCITPDLNDLPFDPSSLFEAVANKFELAVLPSLNLLKSLVSNDITVAEQLCALNIKNLLYALTKNVETVQATLELILLFCCNAKNKVAMIQHSVIINALLTSTKHQPNDKIAESMLTLLLVCCDCISIPSSQYDNLICNMDNCNIVALWLDLLLCEKHKHSPSDETVQRVIGLLEIHKNNASIVAKALRFLEKSVTSTSINACTLENMSQLLIVLDAHAKNESIVKDGLLLLMMMCTDASFDCRDASLIGVASTILRCQLSNKTIVKKVLELIDLANAVVEASVLPLLVHEYCTHKDVLPTLLSLLVKVGGKDHLPDLMRDLYQCFSLYMADTAVILSLCQLVQQYAENHLNVCDLIEMDIASRLLQVHSVHLHRASVLTAVYTTAVSLIGDENHCRDLGRSGFCGVVNETCRDLVMGSSEHQNNLELKISVVQLLSHLSCVDENKVWLENAGVCEYACMLLSWWEASRDILTNLLRLVINMSASGSSAKEQLGGSDMSTHLGKIMQKYADDVEIIKLAQWAVMNLAIDDDNKITLGSTEICSSIITAIQLHSLDVADVALGAVINLCDHNDANKIKLADMYDSIISILRDVTSPHMAAMCGMAIVNLTENCTANIAAYNSQELVDLLCIQLQQRGDVTEVVEQTSWALQIISEPKSLLKAEQVTVIVKLANRYRKVASVAEHLVALLHAALQQFELSESLISRLCTVLPDVLVAQSSNDGIAECGTAIIEKLIQLENETFDHNILQRALLSVLMSLYESDTIVLQCVTALCISFYRSMPSDAIEPYFEGVLKAMRTHFLVEAVVTKCCQVLMHLAKQTEDSASIMARYGACETATAALESHAFCPGIVGICDFIEVLCERTANCYMLGTAGACETLVDALRRHDSMTALSREKCLSTIVCLLKHDSNIAIFRETDLMSLLLSLLGTEATLLEPVVRLLTTNYSAAVPISVNDIFAMIRSVRLCDSTILHPLIHYCCRDDICQYKSEDVVQILIEIQEEHQWLRRNNGCATIMQDLTHLAQTMANRHPNNDEAQQLLCIITDAAAA